MFRRKKTVKKSYRFYKKGTKKRKGFKFLDFGITFLGLLTVLFVLSSIHRLTQTQAEGSSKTTPLRVQIVNASGSKLNPEVVRFLEGESLGKYYLVVVDLKDLTDSPIKETLLLERGGGRKLARQIGEKLGLKRENIISKKQEINELDLSYTLVLGQDYQKLFNINDKIRRIKNSS